MNNEMAKKEKQRHKIKSHVRRHEKRAKEKTRIKSHVLRHEAHVAEKHSQGFTFIELLVAITIIGVFSGVVLGSVNVGRLKGRDAGIKQTFHGLRTQAELFRIDNGNYGTADNTGVSADCATPNSVFATTRIVEMIAKSEEFSGNSAVCASDANKWVASIPLASDATKSWCTDSTGVAGFGFADTDSAVVGCSIVAQDGGGGDPPPPPNSCDDLGGELFVRINNLDPDTSINMGSVSISGIDNSTGEPFPEVYAMPSVLFSSYADQAFSNRCCSEITITNVSVSAQYDGSANYVDVNNSIPPGTCPLVSVDVEWGVVDTDGDGLTDKDEVKVYLTDENNPDTDYDTCSDYDEVNGTTSPLDPNDCGPVGDPPFNDSDFDGLTDDDENNIYYTDPYNSDTDGDTCSDGDEVNSYYTDPNDPYDCGGDPPPPSSCAELGGELSVRVNNIDPDTSISLGSVSINGVDNATQEPFPEVYALPSILFNDYYNQAFTGRCCAEITISNVSVSAQYNGSSNYVDVNNSIPPGTCPNVSVDIAWGTVDTDGDGLIDKDEVKIYLTDENNVDTDGDTCSDYDEVYGSTDPNNPNDCGGGGGGATDSCTLVGNAGYLVVRVVNDDPDFSVQTGQAAPNGTWISNGFPFNDNSTFDAISPMGDYVDVHFSGYPWNDISLDNVAVDADYGGGSLGFSADSQALLSCPVVVNITSQ